VVEVDRVQKDASIVGDAPHLQVSGASQRVYVCMYACM
jgi:hypothetical protein